MSKRRAFFFIAVLTVWLIVVLPLWIIGRGFEGGGFRVPMFGRDRIADTLIFYSPILVALATLIASIVDRFRAKCSKPPVG